MQLRTVKKWKKLLENRALSGLSIKAWCEEKGLDKSSFYKYRNKFNKNAPAENQISRADLRHIFDKMELTFQLLMKKTLLNMKS